MAITDIHPIETTPNRALSYALSDKIVEIKSDDEINKSVPYDIIIDDDNNKRYVRYKTQTSFHDCAAGITYEAFRQRQEEYQSVKYRNGGVKTKSGNEPLMYHLHQSFDGFEVPSDVANEIGRRLAEELFGKYVFTVSTHTNTGNIHNHIMLSAWNSDGKKLNNDLATYREIRRTSDRLCEEYKLSVIEHTREMKLIRYTDKNGVVRMYEPTERKNEIIRKREAGEVTRDDVNSYRNMPQYQETQNIKADNRTEIKSDIDSLLPSCRSYEELLERLRDLGYTIKDKKKNGDWLAHVSYQSPLQEKATREDKLGDGVFYLRENLTRYLDEQAKDIASEQTINMDYHGDNIQNVNVPYFETYEYGRTPLSDINDNYKTVHNNGEYKTVERTETEKKVLADIRIKDSQVRGMIDTTKLHSIISEQGERRRQKKPYLSATEEQRIVAQIQSSFRCLVYTENHHIYSYNQILDLYKASKNKYDASIANFDKAEDIIGQLKSVLNTPQLLLTLNEKIDANRGDYTYVMEDYNEDKRQAAKYQAIITKYKIDTPQGLQVLEKRVAEFEAKHNVNRGYIADVITQMAELENCIMTYDRIDTERGNKNIQAMQEFEKLSQAAGSDEAERGKDKKKGREDR